MRVLVVSEAHWLNTGYSTYYKNICEALHNDGHEVNELACYGNENLKEHVVNAEKCPWNVYLNIPNINSKQRWAEYNESKNSRFDTEFGSWDFENVVIDCLPDVVIAIRDHWYDKFILDSPLSRYYKTILCPTVDSFPQKNDWLDTFKQVDYLTSYNQWSEDWLKTQYGGKNIVGHIPPGSNPEYKPISKEFARKSLGLPISPRILLTVMRNQGRKRFPDLIETFKQFSERTDKNAILYCHTHFQDRGWDIPKLAIQYGIADKVYFSYKCTGCFNISAAPFKINATCHKCGSEIEIASVQNGLSNEELNRVYNSADLYVQWHIAEGFGVPTIEAAAVGLKVITVDYSAQEDVAKKISSFPLDPLILQREMGTLCYRAVPDGKALLKVLENPSSWIYDRDEVVNKLVSNYSWKKTGEKWVELVNSVVPKNNWKDSPTLISPPSFETICKLSTFEFVKACILNVLQDPSVLGSFLHGEALEHLETGYYIPENKVTGVKSNSQKSVTREMVYGKFFNMLENKIKWERNKNKKVYHNS